MCKNQKYLQQSGEKFARSKEAFMDKMSETSYIGRKVLLKEPDADVPGTSKGKHNIRGINSSVGLDEAHEMLINKM